MRYFVSSRLDKKYLIQVLSKTAADREKLRQELLTHIQTQQQSTSLPEWLDTCLLQEEPTSVEIETNPCMKENECIEKDCLLTFAEEVELIQALKLAAVHNANATVSDVILLTPGVQLFQVPSDAVHDNSVEYQVGQKENSYSF